MSVGQKIDSHYTTAKEQFSQQVSEETSSIGDGVQQQVQAKPVSSVAVAIGVGIGAGLLLSTLFTSERTRRERMTRRLGNYLPSGQSLRSSIENILPDVITDRYLS